MAESRLWGLPEAGATGVSHVSSLLRGLAHQLSSQAGGPVGIWEKEPLSSLLARPEAPEFSNPEGRC